MMQYNMSTAQSNIKKETHTAEDENIRLSENLTYLFRMFLVSMLFIVIVLVFST